MLAPAPKPSMIAEVDSVIREIGFNYQLPLTPIVMQRLQQKVATLNPRDDRHVYARMLLDMHRCHGALVALRSLTPSQETER